MKNVKFVPASATTTYNGKPRKRYVVASYAANEIPEHFWIDQGEFDAPGEALECAHKIVRQSLQELHQANRRPDAERLLQAFHCHGEVPAIFGEPHVPFNPYKAAKWHARAIARRSAAVPRCRRSDPVAGETPSP